MIEGAIRRRKRKIRKGGSAYFRNRLFFARLMAPINGTGLSCRIF
jgi:hypothetical protein